MKKKKIYLSIYASIGALLLATIISLINVRPKAEEIYNFSELNTAGYSSWNKIYEYENYEVGLFDGKRIYYDSWYFYMVYRFGSDNPNINSVICSYYYGSDQVFEDDNHPQTEECVDSQYLLECGFYELQINTQNYIDASYLNTLSLPIKLNRNIVYENNQLYYLNLSNTLYAEGKLFFVVRYNIEFFNQTLMGDDDFDYLNLHAPSFIFLEEKISNVNETTNAYEEGQNDILKNPNEYGLFTADQVQEQYNKGLNENVSQSQQYQLGYNAGLESNSVAFGTLIGNIFKGVGEFFEIKVFGDITIGMILAIPVVFGIIWIILKLVRG